MKKLLKFTAVALLALAALLVCTIVYVLSWPEFGGSLEGARLARAELSPQFRNGAFANDPPPPASDVLVSIREMMGDQRRSPPAPFPAQRPAITDLPDSGLRATWFGHATVLVDIDGRRVMTDPMLSDRAFPVRFLAPQRHDPPPMRLERLPPVDVVTISHDHFDHLDMRTIQHLADQGAHIFGGIGIGAHLQRWGVPEAQIHEMDWWETVEHAGLKVHCTPARHYSGRRWMSNATLWASWVVEGPQHSIYHSGDSGYAEHYRQIAERKGAVDFAFVKVGDYGNDEAWQSIHMIPEEAIRAHIDLGARMLFPIHWGTFQLSYHDWDEPIRRAVAAARRAGVEIVTPQLGETVVFGAPNRTTAWWETLE